MAPIDLEQCARIVRDAVGENRLSRNAGDAITHCLRVPGFGHWHAEIAVKLHRGDFADLEDAFHRHIPFGTAGQRGPVGAGINRINDRTITESVQGVCTYVLEVSDDPVVIQKRDDGDLRAVVAYDTRMDSAWFAQLVVEVLLANAFQVHLFRAPVPTPELSHAVIRLKAALGFMVSASHNPPGDNGIKVYWHYGGQVLPDVADGITEVTEQVRQAGSAGQTRPRGIDAAWLAGGVVEVPASIHRSYMRAVGGQGMVEAAGRSRAARKAKLVFTPLHGTGADTVLPVLERAGWKVGETLFIVESQSRPDPKFRGCPDGIPNPEIETSLDAGVALGRRVKADLVLATDPDADRLAICTVGRRRAVAPNFLRGGQLAACLGEWVLSQLKARGELPTDGVIGKSIVTSDLIDDIAAGHRTEVELVGVGFKYIAAISYRLRKTPQRFLFGCEQSYGFLRGMHCRDKDGAVAALLAAELCDHLKSRGKRIEDWLTALWQRHGYHAERATPIRMEGAMGLERIREIMHDLRTGFPKALAGVKVLQVEDALKDDVFNPASRNAASAEDWDETRDSYEALYDSVQSLGWGWRGENILRARLATNEKSWVIIRPSGTEPALKLYVNVYAPKDRGPLRKAARWADDLADRIEADVKGLMGVA